jgi:hypothetical protein
MKFLSTLLLPVVASGAVMKLGTIAHVLNLSPAYVLIYVAFRIASNWDRCGSGRKSIRIRNAQFIASEEESYEN